MRLIATRILAALFFIIGFAAQPSFPHHPSRPLISYTIRVDPGDLSGFAIEMRVRGAGNVVRIAMASHPEYDDRYWRYVENLSAESRGVPLRVTREEDGLWLVDAPGGDLTVRYRIHLPTQTTPTRAAWKPFLSPTGGLIGDLHSFMYVVGAESDPTLLTLEIPKGWAIASGLDATDNPRTFAASASRRLFAAAKRRHVRHGFFHRGNSKAGGRGFQDFREAPISELYVSLSGRSAGCA